MAEFNGEQYVAREPVYEVGRGVKNRQFPTMTYISEKQIPGCNYYVEYGWIYGIPEPNPHIHEHAHDYDEIVVHLGGDWKHPQVLGGEIEFYIGGQPITFNTTTVIYIPAGTSHGPLTWKAFDFPHIEMAIMLGAGDIRKAWGKSGILKSKDSLPVKATDFDFEQYVIRSPIRQASGGNFGHGEQAFPMTYMSSLQIPGIQYHIDFGWVRDETEPVNEMKHDDSDKIILQIGGDPENPEDLGADMCFSLNGQRLEFNKNIGMFIPRGISHGILEWQEIRRPYMELAIMLGTGT